MNDSVRVDKWLWAARFFKTRSLAQDAVERGKVTVNGDKVKPARAVRVGDVLDIDNGSDRWEVDVMNLSEVRGPAPVAIVGGWSSDRGLSPVQVALAWVLAQRDVCAIPKAGSVEHVRANRRALDIVLSERDLAAIDREFKPPRRKVPLEML